MTVLVIGATGRHGGTGQYLVRRLLDEGKPVRVLVRTLDERSDRLAALGAEVAVGDLADRRTLIPALGDVDLAYFTYPIAAGVIPAAANYASAVREVGGSLRTVVMSMGPAHPQHPSELGRAQWLAEQVLEWAGLDVLILRVSAPFHENLVLLHSRSVQNEGVLRNSFGTGPVPWISGEDAAELALAALLHPDRFDGSVVYPGGSEIFTHDQIAELLGELLNRPVRYEPVSKEHWQRELVDLAGTSPGEVVNVAMAQHISSVGEVIARGQRTITADPDALRQWTGRAPTTLRHFLQANLASFQ